ncbi:MAG: sodium ion-translocating decarboxylase subunit beta [Bacteroidales bacterium]|jgi:oxaloacetate decarboxylase beta subunit|nr:sodium ion-translocating decarboxylase subunit beta [Bacteroidales bacterium]NCU34465.1 sodium ion-translocating decarboxylase subunit beta [Candidatus Falkowbacteria bacterium]MDD3525655.1 sodium ion-translocating decarboxylase subunit beta [Bacteroidales bacterium]MDD4175481.1 sodium ion-translocating decarboxylase subunit beta [Bacteroidales bacterium]MDD4739973.1 sodium ion-translocating decarboxylase subunit beta [Bacteroidales bacterium]
MKRLLTVFGIIAIIAAISMVFPKTAFTDTQKDTTELSQPAPVAIDGAQNDAEAATGGLKKFFEYTGFANVTSGHLIMLVVGLIFIYLAIRYDYEPLLLIPIGVGILIGNIPFMLDAGLQLGIYESGSVMNYLYFGVTAGIYPPIIFLGIGAMTDFSSLISNPKLMLLGAAAQVGIFATFLGALILGFHPAEAGAIGIIGGADGPTAIFLSSKLANGVNILSDGTTVKNLIGPIAIAAYSYMALVPVIQPPIMRLLITKKERVIKMKSPRAVSKLEKILFPIIGLLFTAYISPSSLPLLGMLFFGNLLKESGVTKRLADTARTSLIDIVTIVLGLTVGASTQADIFLTSESILIFVLGAASFMIATAGGLLFAKVMNLFLSEENKINPLVGAAGVSAVPDSARVVHVEGLKANPNNHLLMHAMAPNVAGVIGSAVAAGILLSYLL